MHDWAIYRCKELSFLKIMSVICQKSEPVLL